MIDTSIHEAVGHLLPFIAWDGVTRHGHTKRGKMYDYVSMCRMAGFCNSREEMISCANRWLCGKKKITPPGHQKRKDLKKARAKALESVPEELLTIIDTIISSAPQMNEEKKFINYCTGQVLKIFKYDAAVVRSLIEIKKCTL